MTKKTFWRGYCDAQGKKYHPYNKFRMATAKRSKTLIPLAELLGMKVREYRSGFYVKLIDLDKLLPQKIDLDYLRGWFKAKGQMFKNPTRLTVVGDDVTLFVKYLSRFTDEKLPPPRLANKKSKTQRLTIYGYKAKILAKLLSKQVDDK